MGKADKWLKSVSMAYFELMCFEKEWHARRSPYSTWVLLGKKLFSIAIYTIIVWFIITMAIKLNLVVVAIPMG